LKDNVRNKLLDEKWKTLRGALTPLFTVGKLKQFNAVVQKIGEDYAETLLREANTSGGRINSIQFKE